MPGSPINVFGPTPEDLRKNNLLGRFFAAVGDIGKRAFAKIKNTVPVLGGQDKLDSMILEPGTYNLYFTPQLDRERIEIVLRTTSKIITRDKSIQVLDVFNDRVRINETDEEKTDVTVWRIRIPNPAPLALGLIIAGILSVLALLRFGVSPILQRVEKIVLNPISVGILAVIAIFALRPILLSRQ